MLIDFKQVTPDEQRARLSPATLAAKLTADRLDEQKYYHAKIDESPSCACRNKQDNSLQPRCKASIYSHLWNSPAGPRCRCTAWLGSTGALATRGRRAETGTDFLSFEFSFSESVHVFSKAREDSILCHL